MSLLKLVIMQDAIDFHFSNFICVLSFLFLCFFQKIDSRSYICMSCFYSCFFVPVLLSFGISIVQRFLREMFFIPLQFRFKMFCSDNRTASCFFVNLKHAVYKFIQNNYHDNLYCIFPTDVDLI